MEEKVFAIGLNKTGSTSLAKALAVLGYNPSHDHRTAAAIAAELRAGRNPKALMKDHDAFLDFPLAPYAELAEAFPSAKFILNTRAKVDWINSRTIHVLHNRIVATGSAWQDIETPKWSAQWDDFHHQVREYFSQPGRPALLEINIPAGDGWQTLCPFLGHPVPAEPFPHDNQGKDQIRAILKRMDARAVDRFGNLQRPDGRWTAATTIQHAIGIPGWMSEAELNWLYHHAQELEAGEAWVELGSLCGRSLFATAAGLPPAARLVSVEVNPRPELAKVAQVIRDTWPALQLELVAGKSDAAAEAFEAGSVAAVFIDANHAAEAVEKDIRAWWPRLKPGGLLAGHDWSWESVRMGVAAAGIAAPKLMAGGSIWWTRAPWV